MTRESVYISADVHSHSPGYLVREDGGWDEKERKKHNLNSQGRKMYRFPTLILYLLFRFTFAFFTFFTSWLDSHGSIVVCDSVRNSNIRLRDATTRVAYENSSAVKQWQDMHRKKSYKQTNEEEVRWVEVRRFGRVVDGKPTYNFSFYQTKHTLDTYLKTPQTRKHFFSLSLTHPPSSRTTAFCRKTPKQSGDNMHNYVRCERGIRRNEQISFNFTVIFHCALAQMDTFFRGGPSSYKFTTRKRKL